MSVLFSFIFISLFALFLADIQRSTDPLFTLNVAAKNGDYNGVYSAVVSGANINAVDSFSKRSAILNAVLGGHAFILEYLLNQPKVDYYVVDAEGMTMWQHCCTIGRVPIAEVLVKFQVNPQISNSPPRDGIPALHRCVYQETILHTQILDQMKKVKTFDVNHQNPKGITALMVAAKQGNLRNTEWLLQNGAQANAKDYSKRNALIYCIMGLEAKEQQWRDEQPVKGENPPEALREPYINIFRLLIEKGADPESKDIFQESADQMVSYKVDGALGKIIKEYKLGIFAKIDL